MLNDRDLAMKVKLDDNSDDLHIFPNFDQKCFRNQLFHTELTKTSQEYFSNVASLMQHRTNILMKVNYFMDHYLWICP